MITLAAPLWLAALAGLPLIRELHRRRGSEQPVRVPSILLWSDLPDARERGTRRAPPDPAWRRRALAIALMLLALAQPFWRTAGDAIVDIVVDNRPSLLTREADGRTRAEQAAEAIRSSALEAGIGEVRLVPIHGGEPIRLPANDSPAIARKIRDWSAATSPAPGAAAGLSPRRWLVSDGSGWLDAGRLTLPGQGPFEHVISPGGESENQGVTSLGASRSEREPGMLDVLVAVTNLGAEPSDRRLRVGPPGSPAAMADLHLPPGETRSLILRLPAGTGSVLRAELDGSDALALDDRLTLDLAALDPIPTVASTGCGEPLRALISTLPALAPRESRQTPDADPALRIWCEAAEPPADRLATLWLPPGTPETSDAAPLRWVAADLEPASVRCDPADIRPIGTDSPVTGRPLLVAGERPLVLEQAGGRRILVLIETGETAMRGVQTPLILATAIGRLTGRDMLDPRALAGRALDQVRVAPGPVPAASAAGPPGRSIPLWPLAVIAAIAVLVLDLRHAFSSAVR